MNKQIYLLLYFNEPLGKLQLGTRAKFFIFLRELLDRMESIKLNLYFSGFILEWMEREKKDFLLRFLPYIDSGKLDLLAGGFHEPNFMLLPEKRQTVQIKDSISFYKERLNYEPETLFLPRMLWSGNLPSSALNNGIRRIALADEGKSCSGIVSSGKGRIAVQSFDLSVSKKLFLEGSDILPRLNEMKSPHYIALPAELFTNRVGSEWLFNLFDELESTNMELCRLSESTTAINDEISIPEPSLKDCIWLDAVYNYPYYFFFMNDVEKDSDVEVKGSFSQYLEQIREMGRMHELMLEAEKHSEKASKDTKAARMLSSMEFYGYMWPGCFGGMNYTALRQNFFREYLILIEKMEGRQNGLAIRESKDHLLLKSESFNMFFSAADGALKRLDFLPKKCNLINCRKNYDESIKWRESIYGSLENDIPSGLNFAEDPAMLIEQLSFSDGTELILESTDIRSDCRNNICHLDFAKQYACKDISVKLLRAVSVREMNNNIFVTYFLDTDGGEVIECHLRTGFYMGLSHPGYSKSYVRVSAEKDHDLGFECSETIDSVDRLQVFDGLLGVELDFHLEDTACIETRPDYVADRLPEQYQLMFQGIRLGFSWKILLKPGEENKISFGLRIKRYA